MLRDPADRLEGGRILEESPEDLGLLLWRTVRDVTLWATTPEERRENLFVDGTADSRLALLAAMELPAKVSAAVETLHGILAMPSQADAEVVALCCLEVAAWAGGADLAHTAVAFAQAGAVAAPEFGEAALHAGIHARKAGQPARAETWLRRAVAVARRENDRLAYASALAELGALYDSGGSPAQAERFYRFAYRAARRFGARAARMRASHGLFRLSRNSGDQASAAQFALSAQRAYEPDAAGAPDLLLDVARFWTDMGEPPRAGAALRRLVPVLPAMPLAGQLAALSLTARARAELGHGQGARAVAGAAWTLMSDESIPESVRYVAAVDLAHAARVTGDLPAFKRAKSSALRLVSRAEFPCVAEHMARLWPEGESPLPVERAS